MSMELNTAQQLWETVVRMQQRLKDKPEEPERLIEKDFGYLKLKYPKVFEKASQPMSQTDMTVFQNMVNKLSQIENNQLSKHDASVEVGSQLVDIYVKPVVPASAQSR